MFFKDSNNDNDAFTNILDSSSGIWSQYSCIFWAMISFMGLIVFRIIDIYFVEKSHKENCFCKTKQFRDYCSGSELILKLRNRYASFARSQTYFEDLCVQIEVFVEKWAVMKEYIDFTNIISTRCNKNFHVEKQTQKLMKNFLLIQDQNKSLQGFLVDIIKNANRILKKIQARSENPNITTMIQNEALLQSSDGKIRDIPYIILSTISNMENNKISGFVLKKAIVCLNEIYGLLIAVEMEINRALTHYVLTKALYEYAKIIHVKLSEVISFLSNNGSTKYLVGQAMSSLQLPTHKYLQKALFPSDFAPKGSKMVACIDYPVMTTESVTPIGDLSLDDDVMQTMKNVTVSVENVKKAVIPKKIDKYSQTKEFSEVYNEPFFKSINQSFDKSEEIAVNSAPVVTPMASPRRRQSGSQRRLSAQFGLLTLTSGIVRAMSEMSDTRKSM